MENAGYLLAAFGIVWVLFFGYVLSLSGRQKKLLREISTLKDTLEKKEAAR